VTQVWHGLITRAQHMPHRKSDLVQNRQYHDLALSAFSQDFTIWKTKAPALTILQLPTDGPFGRARLWYKQFYNPRAQAGEFQSRANGLHRTREMPAHPTAVAAD
jgi:3-ketosteroid 9alpha-monooxygenase subunit A